MDENRAGILEKADLEGVLVGPSALNHLSGLNSFASSPQMARERLTPATLTYTVAFFGTSISVISVLPSADLVGIDKGITISALDLNRGSIRKVRMDLFGILSK